MAKAREDETLEQLLKPLVEEQGCELDAVLRVQQHGSETIRVTIEQPMGAPPIDSDTLAEVSRLISAALDEADPVDGEYMLEVTTPGIDRLLEKPNHWRRVIGQVVDIRLKDGQKLSGSVLVADEVNATVDVDGEVTTIDYAAIKKARPVINLAAIAAAAKAATDESTEEENDEQE